MTYMGEPYYPQWLDSLASDATLEGAAVIGTARGAEAVHSIVVAARTLYEDQVFSFADDYDDNAYIEEYSCNILGRRPRGRLTDRIAASRSHAPSRRPDGNVRWDATSR